MINQLDENGRKQGVWEDYYHNGNLDSKITYKNGRRHGLVEYYFLNGDTWDRGEYKKSKQRGLWYEARLSH